MIINGTTMVLTVALIGVAGYVGLQLIRQFALNIALENHEANVTNDAKEEQERRRKIQVADQAADDAFKKVEPLLTSNV